MWVSVLVVMGCLWVGLGCRVSMGEMVGEEWGLSYDAERGTELMGVLLGDSGW